MLKPLLFSIPAPCIQPALSVHAIVIVNVPESDEHDALPLRCPFQGRKAPWREKNVIALLMEQGSKKAAITTGAGGYRLIQII